MKYIVLKEIKESHEVLEQYVEEAVFIARTVAKGEKVEDPFSIKKPEDLSLVVLNYGTGQDDQGNPVLEGVSIDHWDYTVDALIDKGAPPVYIEPKVETYAISDEDGEVEVLRIALDNETGEVKQFELTYYEHLVTKIIKDNCRNYQDLPISDIVVDEPEARTTRVYFTLDGLRQAVDVDLIDGTVTDAPFSEG